jgi:hypothetical protein
MYNKNSVDTASENKLCIESKTYEIIKKVSSNNNEWWIGLVGHSSNLKRHIDMCGEIGITPDKMIIIERDEDIYLDLSRENIKFNYGCIIEFGDFNKILEKYLDNNYKFKVIDYDATGKLSINEIYLIYLYINNIDKIDLLRMVVSSRGKCDEKYYEDLSDILGMKPVYKSTYMNKEMKQSLSYCDKLSDKERDSLRKDLNKSNPNKVFYKEGKLPKVFIIEGFCKLNSLFCLFENYSGASDSKMINIIISNKYSLLEYKRFFKTTYSIIEENIFGSPIRKLEDGIQIDGKRKSRSKYYKIKDKIYHRDIGLLI